MKTDLASIRQEYSKKILSVTNVSKSPLDQFKIWFDEAMESKVVEPTAMNLATISKEGHPSSRIVLLKGIEMESFVFYTNYSSKKGKDLEVSPHAALNFFWAELERQVRIEGTVKKIDDKYSEEYFNSRPRGSQIGAWTSPQSQVIKDRNELQKKSEDYELQFKDKGVPRPSHWGGYQLFPSMMEFWQGRPNRLHDRIRYVLEADNQWWRIERLAP